MKSRFSANLPRQTASYRSPVSTLASPRSADLESEQVDGIRTSSAPPATPPRAPAVPITTGWAWSPRDEVDERVDSTPAVEMKPAEPADWADDEAGRGSELDHENWLETLGDLVEQVQNHRAVPLRLAPRPAATHTANAHGLEHAKRELLDSLTDIELVWALSNSGQPARA